MIKFSTLKSTQERMVRETTAPFIIREKGAEKTETIRVRYFSLTVRESREFRAAFDDREDMYLSDILAPVIESLPDFVDDKDQPIEITAAALEDFNAINLRAIQEAIHKDLTGK